MKRGRSWLLMGILLVLGSVRLVTAPAESSAIPIQPPAAWCIDTTSAVVEAPGPTPPPYEEPLPDPREIGLPLSYVVSQELVIPPDVGVVSFEQGTFTLPCGLETVTIVELEDGTIFFLEPGAKSITELEPGRLLVEW
jgi:hypothetical protein